MNTLKTTITFLLILIANPILYGQARNEKIKAIRQEFQRINNDKSLRTKTLDNPEEFLGHGTDGGAQLTGYFKGDTIYKIYIVTGLSYGEIKDEYYFKNEQLIFVYEAERSFPYNDSSGTIGHEKLTLAFEGRYYFDSNKLIGKNEKGKRRLEDKKDISATLLRDAEEYKLLLKPRKSKG